MAARDISSPDNNTEVPVDRFTEMSINNDKIAAIFGNVEDEVNMEYIELDIEKERLDQDVMQDMVDNDHNDDESETESAKEYIVEKVLDHRINEMGKLQYLLKWEGWSSEYNSWENQENIFAEKLITKYWIKKEKLRNNMSLLKKERNSPSCHQNLEDDCDDVQSKKRGGDHKKNKKKGSSHPFSGSSPKISRHHDINDGLCEDSTSSSAENYKDPDSSSFQDKEKQEEKTLQLITTQSTTSQVQQLYSPPSLKKVEPVWWNEFFDPEIREPKLSLDWDKDSTNIDFIEFDDQGERIGYLNWKSGSRSGHSLEELHAKCPQKMLEYYKENLIFKLGT